MEVRRTLPQLAVNQLVRLRGIEGAPLERIVWTGRQSLHTFLMKLDGKEWARAELTSSVRERLMPEYIGDDALEFVSEDPHAVRCHSELSASAKERWAWIRDIVENDALFKLLSPAERGRAIRDQAEALGITRQTITFQVRRWLARGMTVNALEGDKYKCGRGGERRNPRMKVGRKRRVSPGTGTQVNDSNRGILAAGSAHYLSKKKHSFEDSVRWMNRTLCAEIPAVDRFTVDQLKHYVYTNFGYEKRKRKKIGSKKFELNFRMFSGKASSYGPGAEYQIDATIVDVYLVSEYDRTKIVGRPTFYGITDTFSRMIVGVYVGYERPSMYGAALAMENVVTPKVTLCKEYGIDITEDMWPAHHLCHRLLADRGAEFISIDAWERAITRFNITMDNTVAYRPDWKPFVESTFHLLTAAWSPFVPGHVEEDYEERGGNDYRLDATLTLREFMRVLLHTIIEFNNRPMKRRDIPTEMVVDGLAPSPVEYWNFGVENYSGVLRTVSREEMRVCIYPRKEVTVTREGIRFGERFYETDRTLEEGWFAQASEKTKKLTCAYDPADPTRLYAIYDDRKYERGRVRANSPTHEDGLSLAELNCKVAETTRNLNNARAAAESLSRKAHDAIEETIKESKRLRKEAMDAVGLKKLQTDGIRDANSEARADERDVKLMASGERPIGHSDVSYADAELEEVEQDSEIELSFDKVLEIRQRRRGIQIEK